MSLVYMGTGKINVTTLKHTSTINKCSPMGPGNYPVPIYIYIYIISISIYIYIHNDPQSSRGKMPSTFTMRFAHLGSFRCLCILGSMENDGKVGHKLPVLTSSHCFKVALIFGSCNLMTNMMICDEICVNESHSYL